MTTSTILLGELIAQLEKLPADGEINWAFASLPITAVDSWRGVYAELALGWGENRRRDQPALRTVGELLQNLRAAVGRTFEGYKGGQFTMGLGTPVWCDNYGEYTQTRIVSVLAASQSTNTYVLHTCFDDAEETQVHLVRDADPLPDADGWEPKVGDRVKLVKDGLSTVGAVGMEGVIKKIEGGQHPYLIELDEGLVYESYAVPEQYRLTRADRDYFVSAVRPAPSGPVVEETVKRVVPIGSDEWADQAERLEWAYIAGIMRELAGRVQPPLPSYIQSAIDIAEARATEGWRTFRARQIGEAMEGK